MQAPIAIGAAATFAIGAGGVGLASIGIGTMTWGTVIFSTVATAALGGLNYLLNKNSGKGRTPLAEPIAAPINGQRAIPIAQPIPPRRYVYGNARVGGALFFKDNANPKLYIGSAVSDGRIEGIDALYIGGDAIALDGDGEAVEGTPYFEKLRFESANGLPDQTASAMLLAAFPDLLDANFRQRGVARYVVEMDWGTDAQDNRVLWGDGIEPSVQMRGVWCYDPREGGHDIDDESTWAFTRNPALHVAHALTHAWGVAIPHTAVDWDTVETAADVCDAEIEVGGENVPTFTGAGIFQADVEFGRQISDMLSAFRGRIVYQNGKYGIVADASQSSVWTITDEDVLELGDFKHATDSNEYFGAISATYFDSAQGGLKEDTPAYEAEADLRETAIALPFTDSNQSAQILAYRELVQSRDGRAISLRVSDAGIYLVPGERVTLQLASAPSFNGEFLVEQVDLASPGVQLTLRAYNSNVYAAPSGYLQ